MAFNLGGVNGANLIPDSPAVKRQKTASGYTSTSTSARNTGAYNSDNDDGDDIFSNYVPDTPGHMKTYGTQPTQIIDRNAPPSSSRAQTPPPIVQVPASSPFTGRSSEVETPRSNGYRPFPQHQMQPQMQPQQPPRHLAMSMAPAGTLFRPPNGLVAMPPANRNVINLDSDSDGGGVRLPGLESSDDDDDAVAAANIKPTTFSTTTSAQNSFGAPSHNYTPNGNASFQSIVANAKYTGPQMGYMGGHMGGGYGGMRGPQRQMGPERARAIEDMRVDDVEAAIRENVTRLRTIFPSITIVMARNLLLQTRGNLEDAAAMLSEDPLTRMGGPQTIVIPDDPPSSYYVEPQMKRGLNAPIQSLRDKYSSAQTMPRQAPSTPVQIKPKKRLVQGRRNPTQSSPAKEQTPEEGFESMDETDSGHGTEEEEDPELESRLLKFLNECKAEDLVELTSIAKDIAEMMIEARPFKNLDAARKVENTKPLKSGKKSTKAAVGDRVVNTAVEMFQGYEAIDKLVAECGELGKPLAEEMARWGFDVFGAQKGGELEMTSLEDENESQRDSGIGSPSSADAANDDDVKVITRKRGNVKFLKKPEKMAEDCVLKDYQVVGLNWLALMYRHKLSGILADEMGLGKTCQVIAFLTHLVEQGNNGPHLVVCPGSTLENWLREFQKFSPHLTVEPYHGAQKDRPDMANDILNNRENTNVVVTTYDMAAKKEDNKFMKRLRPDVCVYDEGHMLKNTASQRYQGLIKIPANFRLLLTGTPLQNNLQELAALLAFILPQVFRDLEDDLKLIFKAKATTADADHAALLSAQRIARARSMLTPFVLRRKKAQVLKHLPAKTCRVEYCNLHKAQKKIYNGHLSHAREKIRARIEGTKMPKNDENNPMMQLRKAAIHPLLFRRHFTDDKIEKMVDILRKKDPVNFPPSHARHHHVAEMRKASDFWLHQWCRLYPSISSFDIPDLAWMNSGKVEAMVKLVKQYKENGDRVLIFSQMSLVLDILEAVLNSSLIAFTRIDGSTKIEERQSLIDAFRDDESITAFLLTTKAGGTGINLMYANKVIIFDGSFNPQDDRQAENRAHRVGQTREVEVVRLVTRGTVEEQIFALGMSKLALDGRVAGDDKDGEAMGEKEVSRMLLEATENLEPEVDDEDSESELSSLSDSKSLEDVEEEVEVVEVVEEEKEEKVEKKRGGRKAKGEVKEKKERKLPTRRKTSILDQVASQGQGRKRKAPKS